MLDADKHIADDDLFFQEDSAQAHCVCNTIQLSEKCHFRVSQAQVTWGGIVKRLLIAYFIDNICARNIKIHSPVRQSYSKPKVGRFLRHGVLYTESQKSSHLLIVCNFVKS